MTHTGRRGRVLVVGVGIAGIATAVRLRHVGWEPVLVERAAARRSGGYFIMLFGTGVASARRLGVLDALDDRSHPQVVSYEVNRAGRRTPGMNPAKFPVATKPRQLLRGDVEQGLFTALPSDVDIRFGTVPTCIAQEDAAEAVTLREVASGAEVTERFDLVVGADGMRSTVRELVFGAEEFLRPLRYMIGVTVLDRPVDGFGPHEGLALAEPGRSVWTFPFHDRMPSLLFSYRTDDVAAQLARPAIESIRAAFGPDPPGPLLENLFTRFERSEESLFDAAYQVKMPCWHRGRVVLVGDSAWSLTLYAGMGASAAIAGGELLGTMLHRHDGDVARALRAWEARMRPFVETEQHAAVMMRRLFTPRDRREQLTRSAMMRLLHAPVIGRSVGRVMGGPDLANKERDIAA